MIVKIPSVALGVNRDGIPEELPLGQWSNLSNIRFRGGYLERSLGMAQVYTTPSVTPYYITPHQTSSARYLIHASNARIYADDGTTRYDLTPATAYTGAATDRWTGGVIGGVLILNNGVQPIQYWLGNTGTPFANLPGWNVTYSAKAVRAWKNYIFALDVTKAGIRYPYMVKWSSAADPGTYPSSWDEADPANDAGEIDLAETPDQLVDALQMGETLVIYKQRSMWIARYIGGQYIFQFSRLPGEVGLLGRGCAVQCPLGHVCLTSGDVVLHNGQGPTSIVDGIVRRAIFDAMDSTAATLSFLALNMPRNEVWVCYPTSGQTSCNMAAVWNWVDNVWTFRTLPNVTYGVAGQINQTTPSDAWSADSLPWSSDTSPWATSDTTSSESRLILAHTAPALSIADSGDTDLGVAITATAERTGIALDDPETVKLLKRWWPRIDAAAGTTVTLQIGGSMTPDVAPIYSAAGAFTVGTDSKFDSFATGRYLALKMQSTSGATWRIRACDLEVTPMGAF